MKNSPQINILQIHVISEILVPINYEVYFKMLARIYCFVTLQHVCSSLDVNNFAAKQTSTALSGINIIGAHICFCFRRIILIRVQYIFSRCVFAWSI